MSESCVHGRSLKNPCKECDAESCDSCGTAVGLVAISYTDGTKGKFCVACHAEHSNELEMREEDAGR